VAIFSFVRNFHFFQGVGRAGAQSNYQSTSIHSAHFSTRSNTKIC